MIYGVRDVMNNYPLVSIYTCVYNGARTLHRVFDSLSKLDYPNIEHVIINDGSIDETDQVCQEYIRQATYPVKYHKFETNRGKHIGMNKVWDIAEGEFIIQLDADDCLHVHAIKYLVDVYYQIPEAIRDDYWCVHGRCETQHGEFVGVKYPEGVNALAKQDAEKAVLCNTGEVIGLMVRKYICQYKFPEIIGCSHLPESIIWVPINKKYRTWYTNEILRVYYTGEGGNISDKKKKRRQFAPYCFFAKWELLHPNVHSVSVKTFIKYSVFYFITHKKYREHNKYLADLRQYRGVLILLAAIAYPLSVIYRIIAGIR